MEFIWEAEGEKRYAVGFFQILPAVELYVTRSRSTATYDGKNSHKSMVLPCHHPFGKGVQSNRQDLFVRRFHLITSSILGKSPSRQSNIQFQFLRPTAPPLPCSLRSAARTGRKIYRSNTPRLNKWEIEKERPNHASIYSLERPRSGSAGTMRRVLVCPLPPRHP